MEKKTQSRICNWSLLVLAILMLASGIQMEASFGADFLGLSFPVYMVFHVVVALLMTAVVIWHIWLHFNWKEWAKHDGQNLRVHALQGRETAQTSEKQVWNQKNGSNQSNCWHCSL